MPSTADTVVDLRPRVLGIDTTIPLLDGSRVPYVNLDNAASTPPFAAVMDAVARFMPYYASVHRGTGFKSRLSTALYDQAHEIVLRFVGANPETNTAIFGKNTTEGVNKLAYRLRIPPDHVVVATQLEHHSNDLPWRNRGRVVHVAIRADGSLDEDDFDRVLAAYAGRIAIVAVSGASNVTGFIQPVHRLARKAHEAGTRIFVDAAQLAPHRRVDVRPDDDPEHLDFVALSAHKMYAPFGTGALVGPKEAFLASGPEYPGGGTVDVVTLDDVTWADVPDRDEAGSPNVVGAVAMAVAARTLMHAGMDGVAAHEEELVRYALEGVRRIPGVRVYGVTDPARASEKVGVIPFTVGDLPHALVAAVLGYEGGIGVRSGCFCAHPYVVRVLGLSAEATETWRRRARAGDHSNMPGLVRASFGCYNTTADIDRLLAMLERIARGAFVGDYRCDVRTGEYIPAGFEEPFSEYFIIENGGGVGSEEVKE